MTEEEGKKAKKKPTTDHLLRDIYKRVGIFRSTDGQAFARVENSGHTEIHRIGGQSFRGWLASRFISEHGYAPPTRSLEAAIAICQSTAEYLSTVESVAIRVSRDEVAINIDIGDPDWRMLRITADEISVVPHGETLFWRPPQFGRLPEPDLDGTFDILRPFVNVDTEEDWAVLQAFIVGCFNSMANGGTFPVLFLSGTEDSGKTTLAKVLKAIIDPELGGGTSQAPASMFDMILAASNRWLVSFNNISYLDQKYSDVLCQIVDGTPFRTRVYYLQRDELTMQAKRPIVINAIPDVIRSADLASRTLTVEVPRLKGRQSELDFWGNFDVALPAILGAALKALQAGLRNDLSTGVDPSIRLSDFARWASACEPGLDCARGSVQIAIMTTMRRRRQLQAESSELAIAIVKKVENECRGERAEYLTTAKELIDLLTPGMLEYEHIPKWLPTTPQKMSSALNRISKHLESLGVRFERVPRTSNLRQWKFTLIEESS